MIPIAKVAKHFKISAQTIRNWIIGGKVVNGRKIRLAATLVGGRWYTRKDALRAFLSEVTNARLARTDADWPGERAEAAKALGGPVDAEPVGQSPGGRVPRLRKPAGVRGGGK